MYDPHAALEAIDSHTLSILLFYAVAVLAGFVYFIEAIRLTISQKVYAVPLATAIFIFAHDLSFLVYYDKWFNQYGHWWCKAWWFVLLITVPLEMLLIYFVARYGRAETFPFLKQKGFTVLVILATVGLSVFWLLVKDAINDELYFVSFAVTVFSPLPFSTALMIRRQSRQGQSVLMQLTQIPQALALLAAYSFIDSYFYSPIFISFILVIVTWACVNIWLLRRLPENSPGASDLAGHGSYSQTG
ncbi:MULTISPECIES: hypothetical protein [Mycobacterium]|uniref:Uncharacterized protein n=1 Tax=Mycobacterium kiyosense TaxID=2871094 RepID=A0A9P3Q9S4_9MYCO|nr:MULTISPECIES: hypothetical protein [Mycobacterium]BDE16247.1 hypothetical protein MKCMC460_51070 [Mycobacterium sp. 20KCMC460]GLB86071.1 hypothetical protein SRL2020028_53270 [Mycobacterium kiyosense]GLB92766.1 hypothetical protein SRL2020130_55830 [Mycobacterium kiyosense]GLB98681.1 hypothetical protein SRL2020226_54570 [Mycobacterium kiyosense]GLC00302.1 hypothetical protein SRL2020400_08930 [Mycobacterium kiyosense]